MGKKKGKKTKLVDPNAVTNVDKAFHELLVADISKKMERLRNLTEELTAGNEALELQIKVADNSHGDLIASLKRSLLEKSDEVSELQNLLYESERLRAQEDYDHQAEIIQKFEEYRLAHEQLTSEIKLLSGRLVALEEFRSQREQLFEKYELQQQEIAEKEAQHKKALYEIEKKFIVAKDKLKIEMEARLVKLSTEFQEITEMRIATTTHRVVRENIAVNNELDSMLISTRRLHSENNKLTENNGKLKVEATLHNTNKKTILGQCVVQEKVLEGLDKEVAKLKSYAAGFDGIQVKVVKLQQNLDGAQLQTAKSGHRLRLLEQNLHGSRAERTRLKTEFDYCKEELDRCSSVIYEVLMTIKTSLLIKIEPKESLKKLAARRKTVMSEVLAVLIEGRMAQIKRTSLESIPSVKATYDRGDLGFQPIPVVLRSDYPIKRSTGTKLGHSFEDLVNIYLEEQKQMRSLETDAEADDDDLEMERSATMIRKQTREEPQGPWRTVFDDSTEVSSKSTSDEVTYHVQLPPQTVRSSRQERMEEEGDEMLSEGEYEEEEDEEGQEQEEGEEENENTTITNELEMEALSEGVTEEGLSEG